MVECRLFPRLLVVTGLALRAFLSFVLVVSLVAAVAIHRGVFVPIVLMAIFAGDLHVFVAKLVAGFVMIKPDVLPIPVGMTVGAGASHSPLMLVVFFVAGVAIHGGVFEGRRQMALFAFDLGMFARKSES